MVNKLRTVRRIAKEYKKPTRSFAIAVGEVVWASNTAHAAFSRLFAFWTSPENFMIGLSMWHTIPSDAGQRDIFIALVESKFQKDALLLSKLRWAKQIADDLGSIRNDAVHMATLYKGDTNEVIPDFLSTTPKRFNRLDGKDFIKVFRLLRGDYIALSHYLNAFLFWAVGGKAMYGPFPRKPKILSIVAARGHNLSLVRKKRKSVTAQRLKPTSNK